MCDAWILKDKGGWPFVDPERGCKSKGAVKCWRGDLEGFAMLEETPG